MKLISKIVLAFLLSLGIFVNYCLYIFHRDLNEQAIFIPDQKHHIPDSASPGRTDIYLIGTRHSPSINYTADTILKALSAIKPDVILCEVDTSFFTKKFEWKYPLKFKLAYAVGKVNFENEPLALIAYKHANPSVELRPYDYEGRNQFHRKHKINKKTSEAVKAIEKLATEKRLLPKNQVIWRNWKLSNSKYVEAYKENKNATAINSIRHMAICEQRQFYKYQKLNQIIQSEPALSQYRKFYGINAAFWDDRNLKMVNHISNFSRQFSGQRIMVLTGATHTYYLKKELEKDSSITLKEYFK